MVTPLTWYGETAVWWAPVERDARRRFGPTLSVEYGDRSLTYVVHELDVIGDPQPVAVTIQFFADPPYETYGIPPQDFPRVYAKPGATSKHRYPNDDALCLWCPEDSPDQRWTSSKGLLDLIEITRRHLYLENYWRATGGHNGGCWLLDDAPHGLGSKR